MEAYFETFVEGGRLYYERRSRQFNALTGIEKTRIITPSLLIRSYAAIFLEEPHRTTRNYRSLLAQLGVGIFGSEHRLAQYYFAASVWYRLEFMFRNGLLEPKYKLARYHVLLAARLLLADAPPPPPNSREIDRYCEPMTAAVWDTELADDLFGRAAAIVDAAAEGNFDRDHIRTQPFTEELKRRCQLEVAGRAGTNASA